MSEVEETEVAKDPNAVEVVKMTSWKNEPQISDLKQSIDDAALDQEKHKQKVTDWLANRANVRAKTKGKSSVAPKLIRKQAEWRYSSLAEPFLGTPDIFNVYPKTSGDVKRARQNGMILNNQFNTQLNKVDFIDDYVRDAVDIGTVIIKTGWESEEEERTNKVKEYQYMPDESGQLQQHYMALLQMRMQDGEQYADHSTPGLDHALDMFQQTGVAHFVKEVGETLVTKIVETKNQPVAQICPSGNVIFDPSCEGDLDKAIFVGEKFKSSLAELTRDGKYTNLDQINIPTTEGPLDVSDDEYEKSKDHDTFAFKDKARKQFIVHTYWGEWDVNGDGTTKQIVCSWVGNTCIRKELNPFPDQKPPFIIAVYMPVRDSLYGEPDGELLKENQDIIGAVTRGAIDLLAKSANAQTGMRKDMLDTTNRRLFKAGSDYEFNGNVDPNQGVFQHKFPELPRSVFDMLAVQNTEAESLTGVKAYNSGINAQALGAVASNAGRALDAAAQRELGILRRLSQGILQLGRKIIAMNAEFLADEEVIRITDEEFVQVRRDDLAGNFDLRLTISTAEEDAKKASELAFMLQTGGPNMDLEFVKIILAEVARLRKMPALAEKIENFQPEPDPIAQAKAQKELQLMDAQIEKELALSYKHRAEGDAAGGRGEKDAAQGRLNDAKVTEEQSKARKHGSDADRQDLDYVQEADGTKHQRELEKQDRKDGNAFLQKLMEKDNQDQNAA